MTKPTIRNPSEKGRADDGQEYAALLRAAQAGNQHALERLLMRAQEVAWRFSRLVCGRADDAEDAMQEALLKTYRHLGSIKQPEAFRTWLYRTVKNACLIGRRRRVDEPQHLLSLDDGLPADDGQRRPLDAIDPRKGPHELAVNTALKERLQAALAALPPQYRLIVFLREVEGLSTREVAGVVGISEANVKTRLHRARAFLRSRLESV